MKLLKAFFLLFFTALLACSKVKTGEDVVVSPPPPLCDTVLDCAYSFEEATRGSAAPQNVLAQLELLEVTYLSFDGKIHRGQILLHRSIADDVAAVFRLMLAERFPVEKVIPVVAYDWDDERSMAANNTSAFCYRNLSYSFHASGRAVDINPRLNPVVWRGGGKNQPEGSVYNPQAAGVFTPESPVVKEFLKRGFRWGAKFSQKADYHHFEKGNRNIFPQKKENSDSTNKSF